MRSFSRVLPLLLAAVLCRAQTTPKPANDQPPVETVSGAQEELEHGQPQEAIAALQKLATANPPAKGANRELAIAYYRTGKLVEAERTFAQAIVENPQDIESVQMRGLTLYRLGQPAAAIPYLERVRQWTPNANADANYVLGLCYMNARRYDDARGAFAAQYALEPTSAAAFLLTAQIFLGANLPELAAQFAQKALDLAPRLPLAHFLLGEVFLFRSDVEHARAQFEQEQQINPGYAAVYDRLGDVYTRAGDYQKAQESLTKAISLDQSSTGPFIQMGKVFLRRNDPETAAMYLQHASRMDPGNYITHTLLSQAYKSLGRTDEARREMELVGKIHSDSRLKLEPVQ